MAKFFVSVPIKLLMLITAALLLLSIWFSSLSLTRLNNDFDAYQSRTITLGKEQFQLHNVILRDKVKVWLESIGNTDLLGFKGNVSSLNGVFERHFNALQLYYNVEDLWLVDEQGNVVYSSTKLKKVVRENIDKAGRLKTPQQEIFCEIECLQLLTVPIINLHGEMIYASVSISLVDMIFAIHQSMSNDVAVVKFPKASGFSLAEMSVSSASNNSLLSVLKQFKFNKDTEVENALLNGFRFDTEVDDELRSYFIHLLPLAENSQQKFYMLLADDVTPFNIAFEQSRRQFLLSTLLIFFTLAVFVYIVTSSLTSRLLVLADILPLLAKKEFEQFRKVEIKNKKFLTDELDVLTDSTVELSYELEQLNIEVEQKTKELENIAMFDLLTGLPNRNMLNYQLKKSLARLELNNTNVAVLFLDLDDFKKVNDSHGHGEGDLLLVEAASRLRLSVNNTDLTCRFGGDEFVILLNNIDTVDDAVKVAEDILQRFKMPIKIGSSMFYVSTSIGIAFCDKYNIKAEELISYADIAMYEAKDNGGSQYHVYHTEMYMRVSQRVMLEREVRQALAKNQFSLSLQPQLATHTNEVAGFEALLRWQHPERGMVSPDDFIPILENSTHMIELGYWIIRRCFELSVEIQKRGLTKTRIAINLSAGQFLDHNLPNYLEGLLEEFELSASSFELELTEQTLVKDIKLTIESMEAMRKLGFTFAIDDFGTGYSSLAYLKQMPVDVIKIDRSFIFGMLENNSDYQIIMSTIAMVKNLSLTVVAEGVETSAQLRCLQENDCDIIQGYYFSKPIPEAELMTFIDNHIVDGVWKTKATNESN